jgi:hypothetical protein
MFREPDTRPNERTTKGEHPYKDDRETMGRQEEELQAEAERIGEEEREADEAGHVKHLEKDAEKRFEKIGRKERS